LRDGSHTLYVQEQDGTGNWSASERGSFPIFVDTTAPMVQIDHMRAERYRQEPARTIGHGRGRRISAGSQNTSFQMKEFVGKGMIGGREDCGIIE